MVDQKFPGKVSDLTSIQPSLNPQLSRNLRIQPQPFDQPVQPVIYRVPLVRFSCPEPIHTHPKLLGHAEHMPKIDSKECTSHFQLFDIRHLIFVTSNPVSKFNISQLRD